MAFSPVDDQLAGEFEQLLLSKGKSEELQDELSTALQWTERRKMDPTFLKALESNARHVVKGFLERQPPITAMGGRTPHPDTANQLTVTHDGQGHVTINLPAEVRAWLMKTQSSPFS